MVCLLGIYNLEEKFEKWAETVPYTFRNPLYHWTHLELKTQATDIPAQLRQGIRAFDIRLEKKGNKLGVFHSHAFQDIYWEDDVLPAFIHFLQTYPSVYACSPKIRCRRISCS